MAKTYADIQKQIAALQKAAELVRQKEVDGVIERIKIAIASYGLTARDLGLGNAQAAAKTGPKKTRKVKAKASSVARYRDESGKTWSGRGRRPGWFIAALASGKKAEDLRA